MCETHVPRELALNRRQVLFRWANGFGGLALCGLLASCSRRPGAMSPAVPQPSRPRAKNVIFLYMDGGPSQIDTFDPKPRLDREHGQPIRESIDGRFATKNVMKSPFRFQRSGESGAAVSEIFPWVARHVDEMTIVRSMVAETSEHPTANFFMTTGSSMRGRPSIGSWLLYGLGSEAQNLPGYVVVHCGPMPQGGKDIFSSGFLPAKHQPMFLSAIDELVEDIDPLEPDPDLQRSKLRAIRKLNRLSRDRLGESSELDALIENYSKAFQLQKDLLNVTNFSRETQATQALYGIDEDETHTFGVQCLWARRLVEAGVRFVHLLPPTTQGADRWDQHADLEEHHRKNARMVDKPIAGLLTDLGSRGLLDETIVIWGGEFGRTPTAEMRPGMAAGRDHNPYGFTMWLAGGGFRRGTIYGATDEYGYQAIENPVTVHDLHATILHLLGIDHTQLTYDYGGRDFRLTDVFGEVKHDLIA